MTPPLETSTNTLLFDDTDGGPMFAHSSQYFPGSGLSERLTKDPNYCSSVRNLYSIMHFKGDKLRQTRKASTFIDSAVGGHVFQMLVDTGNLSKANMLDYEEFKAIKALHPTLKLRKITREIHTAGYHKLKGKGTFSAYVQLGKSTKPIATQFYVVKNLGVPSILSADTIADISLILDLSRAQARLGGENGTIIPLKPYNENSRVPYPSNLDNLLPTFKFLKEEDLAAPQYAKVGMQAEIEPRSIAMVHLSVPPDTRNNQSFSFEFDTPNPKLDKCVAMQTLLFCQDRTKCNNKVNVRKWLPKGCYLQLMNCTDEVIKIPSGTVLGTMSRVNKYENKSSKQSLRGSDLHAVSEPLKLIPIPNIDELKHKNINELKKALNDYMGTNSEKDSKKLKEMKDKLDELNKNGIKEDVSLSLGRKELLYHVLLRFYKSFSKSQYDVGLTDLVEFKIDTGDAEPIKAKTRPMNPAIQEALREHLKAQLAEGILAPGNGPWASAVVVVLKKNGEIRFVFDFRAVNKVTVTDSYPIAHQQMAIATEEFRKAESFISLDLAGAYLAVPVEKESQDKLAITTCEGLYKCLRMPFGAKNACGCYARLMRLVFNDMMMRRESLSFFDDHLIVCPDFLTGLFRLCKFLFAVEQANLRVSLKKSHFFVKKVEWLGFEATAGELLPSDRHIEKVKNWPKPKDSDEIASFYGLASYHRRFIKDFATIARPLKQVQAVERETKKFEWTSAAQKSFDELKERLTTKPILAHPDFTVPLILSTDASLYAMGAELSQIQGGEEKVIAYASKLFSKRQMNYSVTRKELLAIVTFIKEFKYYLQGGKPFRVRTDHSALTWFKDCKSLTGQLWRWLESLNGFEYTIEHRAGLKHGNADALSRYPYPQEERAQMIPHLTDLDKEMYEKCGIKPPTRNSIGRKIRDEQYNSLKEKGKTITQNEKKKSLPTVHLCTDETQTNKKGDYVTQFTKNCQGSKSDGRSETIKPKNHGKKKALFFSDESNKKAESRTVKHIPQLNVVTRARARETRGTLQDNLSKEEESNQIDPNQDYEEIHTQCDSEPQVCSEDTAQRLEQEILQEATPAQQEGEFLETDTISLQHDATEESFDVSKTAHDIDKCQCVRPDFDLEHFKANNAEPKSVVINRNKLVLYDVAKEQKLDPLLRKVYGWLQSKQKPLWAHCTTQPEKEYFKRYDRLVIENGQILLKDSDGKKICVPAHLIVKAIDLLHQHPLAGHIGIYRTHQQARKLFYWPSMTEQIEKAINSCSICLKAKQRKPKKQVPMGQTSTAVPHRLQVFYADLVGPWIPHPMPGKYQYLLTLTDAFTKFPEAIPIPKADSTHVLRALATHIIPRYGVGMTLVTDNGSQFTSLLFEQACRSLGLLTAKTQAYEPHSNPVERMHRTLESSIRALMLQDGATKSSNWSDYVPAALASIRQSPLSTLPYSPHFLLYGEEPIIPAHRAFGALGGVQESDMTGFNKLAKAMDHIRAKQLQNHINNKKYYDKKVKETPIKVGDMVYLYTNQDTTELGNLRKTSTYYKGPYKVMKILNARQIEIQIGLARKIVSRDRLFVISDPALSQELTLLRKRPEIKDKVLGNVQKWVPNLNFTKQLSRSRATERKSNSIVQGRSRSSSSSPCGELLLQKCRLTCGLRDRRQQSVCTLFSIARSNVSGTRTTIRNSSCSKDLEPPLSLPRKLRCSTYLGDSTYGNVPTESALPRTNSSRNKLNNTVYTNKSKQARVKDKFTSGNREHKTDCERTDLSQYGLASHVGSSTPLHGARQPDGLDISPIKASVNRQLFTKDQNQQLSNSNMAEAYFDQGMPAKKFCADFDDSPPSQGECVWIFCGTPKPITARFPEYAFISRLFDELTVNDKDFLVIARLRTFFRMCRREYRPFPLFVRIKCNILTFRAKRLANVLGLCMLFHDSYSKFVNDWEPIPQLHDLKDLPEPSLKKKGQGPRYYGKLRNATDMKQFSFPWNDVPELAIDFETRIAVATTRIQTTLRFLPQTYWKQCFDIVQHERNRNEKLVINLSRVKELLNEHDFSYKQTELVPLLNEVIGSGIQFLQPKKANSDKFDMLSYSLRNDSWLNEESSN